MRSKDKSFKFLFLFLFSKLSKKRRLQILVNIILMILSGIFELFNIASLIPFLTAITEKEKIFEIKFLDNIFSYLSITEANTALIFVSFIFISFTIFSSLIKILTLSFSTNLSFAIGNDLSSNAYKLLIYQTYEKFTTFNSSNLIAALVTHSLSTTIFLTKCFEVLTSAVLSLFILGTIFLVDWQLSLGSLIIIGIIYIILAKLSIKRLTFLSLKIANKLNEKVKYLQESFSSIRDIKLDHSEDLFIKNYKSINGDYNFSESESKIMREYPRYLIEAVGIVVLVSLSIYINLKGEMGISILPTLGSFALASQRLLPSFQRIYSAWANIKTTKPSVEKLIEILNLKFNSRQELITNKNLKFEKSIILKDVFFKYKGQENPILKNINLRINKGQKIAIVGKTGSGKSTLIDILMGFLSPSNGDLFVDETLISFDNPTVLNKWRSYIALVPQNIFLFDKSIGENIAFKDLHKSINKKLLKSSSEKANIHKFINSLPYSYDTRVGERGQRLSGGQRQRIGIAKAFYKDAEVIVLDEATSALDNKTEADIMTTINNLDKNITLIMITHKLSILSNFDKIYEISDGVIKEI